MYNPQSGRSRRRRRPCDPLRQRGSGGADKVVDPGDVAAERTPVGRSADRKPRREGDGRRERVTAGSPDRPHVRPVTTGRRCATGSKEGGFAANGAAASQRRYAAFCRIAREGGAPAAARTAAKSGIWCRDRRPATRRIASLCRQLAQYAIDDRYACGKFVLLMTRKLFADARFDPVNPRADPCPRKDVAGRSTGTRSQSRSHRIRYLAVLPEYRGVTAQNVRPSLRRRRNGLPDRALCCTAA